MMEARMGKKFDRKEAQLDKQLNYREAGLKGRVGLGSINIDSRFVMIA